MKKERQATRFFGVALLAAGLFAGCSGETNWVVDETDVATSTASESPASESPASESPASESPASESPAPESPERETRSSRIVGNSYCVLGPERVLFNGENLDGWTNESGGAPGSGWRAENGFLRLKEPGQGGDLLTREAFSNYVLEFEFRFGKECNSGVKYKLEQPNGKGWIGLEYQIQDDANVADGQIAKRKIASLFDVFPALELSNVPAPPVDAIPSGDEFRAGQIVVFGNVVEHWLDNEKVLTFEIGSDEWNRAKSESKYKNQKTFGETASSPILLQDHGFPIDFRKITVRSLTASTAPPARR